MNWNKGCIECHGSTTNMVGKGTIPTAQGMAAEPYSLLRNSRYFQRLGCLKEGWDWDYEATEDRDLNSGGHLQTQNHKHWCQLNAQKNRWVKQYHCKFWEDPENG